MPLTNLLLVFSPSMNMSLPVLKLLCEHEQIWKWQQPPGKNTKSDIPSDKPSSLTAQSPPHFKGLGTGPRPPKPSGLGRRVAMPILLGDNFDGDSGLIFQKLNNEQTFSYTSNSQEHPITRNRSRSASDLSAPTNRLSHDRIGDPSPGTDSGPILRSRASTVSTTVSEYLKGSGTTAAMSQVPSSRTPVGSLQSASASVAALVSLPPASIDELEWLDKSDDGAQEDGHESDSSSRRHTLQAPYMNQWNLEQFDSSASPCATSSTSSIPPPMIRDQSDDNSTFEGAPYSSLLTLPASARPPTPSSSSNNAADLCLPDGQHSDMQMLRQLKAFSETEFDSGRHNKGTMKPLRHVLSLNLLRTKSSFSSDGPPTARSLPSPRSLGSDRRRVRLPSLLKPRATASYLNSFSNKLSSATEVKVDVDHGMHLGAYTHSRPNAISLPPKLTLPFETAPYSPLNIRMDTGEARKSMELPIGHAVLRPRSVIGRARSSPLLNTWSKVDLVTERSPIRGQSGIEETPVIAPWPSLPPTLCLSTELKAENDWAQSVLIAASASAKA